MAGLLDALKQYIQDAAPGGALNQEQPKMLGDLLSYGKQKAQYIGGLLGDAASSGAQAYGSASGPLAPQHARTLGGLLADFTPVVGDVKSAYDGFQSAKEGDYLGAGLGALGVLPMVPNLAGMIKATKRTPLYHGTADIFENFDLAKTGSKQYSDWGHGVYLTPSKSNADYYRMEAVKKMDSARNAAFDRYEALSKNTPVANGSPRYSDEAIAALKEFQRISSELNKRGEGGAVMERYLSDKAKVANHYIEPGSITDTNLGKRLAAEGYDAVNIFDRIRDGGKAYDRLSEVLVMNPRMLER